MCTAQFRARATGLTIRSSRARFAVSARLETSGQRAGLTQALGIMETIRNLEAELGKIASYDDFCHTCSLFAGSSHQVVFQALWPPAIGRSDATEMAGYMLAELQPDSNHGIESLMAQIHSSALDASNRIVPFYLVSQFGRRTVLRAASDFIRSLPQGSPRSRVDAVQYWAAFPASELCKQFHDWEARDTYGISDDA